MDLISDFVYEMCFDENNLEVLFDNVGKFLDSEKNTNDDEVLEVEKNLKNGVNDRYELKLMSLKASGNVKVLQTIMELQKKIDDFNGWYQSYTREIYARLGGFPEKMEPKLINTIIEWKFLPLDKEFIDSHYIDFKQKLENSTFYDDETFHYNKDDNIILDKLCGIMLYTIIVIIIIKANIILNDGVADKITIKLQEKIYDAISKYKNYFGKNYELMYAFLCEDHVFARIEQIKYPKIIKSFLAKMEE